MEGFDPKTSFGPDVAASYDDALRGDEDETVEFLAGLAGFELALELAIGTGRIALPLSERGIRVDGIELSADMIARLREKPGGENLTVVVGDMATAEAPGPYGLVYLIYNTFHNLQTQDDQVRCFENAARHLTNDGVFVIECELASMRRGRSFVDAERVGTDEVTLDVNRYDAVSQVLDENHVRIGDGGIRMGPISQRLVHPSEMDLMARIAGLRLRHRWSGWREEPFTASSTRHVSVYGRG
ncbi:MAG: methyltransferase domain-containing protein [Acidimicrobiia bacterium]|nr:methyltransferase domain-containing protein [Acidimicrobiia bacterium]